MSDILAASDNLGLSASTSLFSGTIKRSLPVYTLSDRQLGVGASLGNGSIWINTKSTGAIERVFSNELAQSLFGAVSVQYGGHGIPLSAVCSAQDDNLTAHSYIGLRPDTNRRTFEIHSAYQRVRFMFGGIVEICETTFVPLGDAAPGWNDPPIAYVMVHLFNRGDTPHRLRAIGSAGLRGMSAADIEASFDSRLNALVAHNVSAPNSVRIFGLSEPPSRYATTFDFGSTYDWTHVHALDNKTDAAGDILGRLQLDLTLGPGEHRAFCFSAGVFANGELSASQAFSSAPTPELALERTISHLQGVLSHSEVLTPDPLINEGALWSKVNMRRVMASYPQGRAFTNDPGEGPNVVIRDAAWFVYGNDHFMPEFSREMLDNIASRQYPDGKLPEYFNSIDGRVEDDGLNINDDTPLYVLAVNHHFRATGDLDWLARIYKSVSAAARYIISQTDKRGLVYCSANDPRGNVWATASWRNIIPGYSINGAVTEINAECVAALRAASHLAENLGGHLRDEKHFADAARRVQEAMSKHLINPDNGLYYLNIDVDGNVHTDVTGDEIFPVMFRACDEETGYRIISRLNSPDFWTPAGLRTASRNDPNYDPSAYTGLMGGVWPGLTWWYAFAAARYHPEFMVNALRSSFGHYGADPIRTNTVPGQFGEWFDGESLTNLGMRLSPWEPPRFLWAAIEGVCGLMITPNQPRISPLIPSHWSWVALRNLQYHGRKLTYFAVKQADGRLHIHSTADVTSEFDITLYDHDVSDEIDVFSDTSTVIALSRKDCIVILVGNTDQNAVSMPINIEKIVNPVEHYRVRIYNSERGAWIDGDESAGCEMAGLAISIETNGFRLIELSIAAKERKTRKELHGKTQTR